MSHISIKSYEDLADLAPRCHEARPMKVLLNMAISRRKMVEHGGQKW